MFTLEKHLKLISTVEHDSIKCGLGNKIGNTGGIAIKLLFEDTKLCFLNCALPLGKTK